MSIGGFGLTPPVETIPCGAAVVPRRRSLRSLVSGIATPHGLYLSRPEMFRRMLEFLDRHSR